MKQIVVIIAAMFVLSCGNKEPDQKPTPGAKSPGIGFTDMGSDGYLFSVPDNNGGHIYLHVDRTWHCPVGKPCTPPTLPHWPTDCPGCTDDGCPCSMSGCKKFCRTEGPGDFDVGAVKKMLPDYEKVMSTSRAPKAE